MDRVRTIVVEEPTARELAALRDVAAEVRGHVLQDGDHWSLVVQRADDAEFAGMRLATELNGVLVDDVGGGMRVDVGRDRAQRPLQRAVEGPPPRRIVERGPAVGTREREPDPFDR